MRVSSGPYLGTVPFATIQDIRLSVDAEGSYTFVVDVSNERKLINRASRTYQFSNLVYFTSDKNEVNNLSSSESAIKSFIMANPKLCHNVKPSGKDYEVKTQDGQGNYISSYVHRVGPVTVPNTKNVYLLVCSYVKNDSTGGITIGNIAKETVVNNRISPIDATLYKITDTVTGYGKSDTVWPGSVHSNNGSLMAGNSHVAAQHPFLTTTTVMNLRLKDLRVIDLARSLRLQVTRYPKEYYSPVTLSRASNGSINGFCTFNILNFAKNNSKYGGFIDNDSTLLSSVLIRDVIVSAKITNKQDSRGNELTPGRKIYCGKKEANVFKRVANLNNGCTISNNTNDNAGLVDIFFTDNTVQDILEGSAEYRIEIIFDDKAKATIDNSLNSIRRLNSRILPNSEQPAALYDELVANYLGIVDLIFGPESFSGSGSGFTKRFWRKNLLAMLNKFNPNLSSDRVTVLNTINNLIIRLADLTRNNNSKTESFNVNSTIYISKTPGILSAVKILAEKFEFAGTKNYGMNYLDDDLSIGPTTTVPTISFDSYSNRAQAEVVKYEIVNTQAAQLNPAGFLTAKSINLTANPRKISTSKLKMSTKESIAASLPLVKNKVEKNSTFKINKALPAPNVKNDILRSLNISVTINPAPLKNITGPSNNRMVRDIIDSSEFLSNTSRFVYEEYPSTINSGSTGKSVLKVQTKNNKVMGSSLVNTIIDKTTTSFKKPTTIKNEAALAGSPALQKLREDSTVIVSGSAFSNAVNFNQVGRIEYLDNYSSPRGKNAARGPKVKKQNWKLLTPEKLSKSKRSSKPLVCRVKQVNDALGTEDLVGIPPMSSMFVIGVPKSIRPRPPRVRPLPAITYDLDNVDILYSKNVPFRRFQVAATVAASGLATTAMRVAPTAPAVMAATPAIAPAPAPASAPTFVPAAAPPPASTRPRLRGDAARPAASPVFGAGRIPRTGY